MVISSVFCILVEKAAEKRGEHLSSAEKVLPGAIKKLPMYVEKCKK